MARKFGVFERLLVSNMDYWLIHRLMRVIPEDKLRVLDAQCEFSYDVPTVRELAVVDECLSEYNEYLQALHEKMAYEELPDDPGWSSAESDVEMEDAPTLELVDLTNEDWENDEGH